MADLTSNISKSIFYILFMLERHIWLVSIDHIQSRCLFHWLIRKGVLSKIYYEPYVDIICLAFPIQPDFLTIPSLSTEYMNGFQYSKS